jgi:hypothetical protein
VDVHESICLPNRRIECDVGTDEENLVEFAGQGGLLRSDFLAVSPNWRCGDGSARVFVVDTRFTR